MAKMAKKNTVAYLQKAPTDDLFSPAAIWRLVGSGTATYLSYWSLYFALQRAFSGR
jgi:hypothetical protein